jgi:hypothetical protein
MGEEINNGTKKLYIIYTIAIEIWEIVRQDNWSEYRMEALIDL